MANACSECHAPAGKPHATNCSRRGGAESLQNDSGPGKERKAAQPPAGEKKEPKPQGGSSTALSAQQRKVLDLGRLIEEKRDALALVAGKHFDATRLVKLGQAAIARNPKIALCNTATVLVCLMRAAELNLEPDAALPQRRIWLVPRKNHRLPEGMECTYVIDYRAKVQLSRDTGLVPSITADVVYEKDRFTYRKSAEGESITKFEHEPDVFADDRGKVRGYYAVARLHSGEVQAVVWSLARMKDFQKRHASSDDPKSPWLRDFEPMALKTMLNQLVNLLPAGESAAAKRLQEISQEEEAIETTGRTVDPALGASGPVDLGIVPAAETTDEQVEKELAGDGAKKDPPPPPAEEKPKEQQAKKDEHPRQREPGEEG